jgi:hypothetical protein
MPTLPPKGCSEPGCPRYAVRNGRCKEHARATERTYDNFRKQQDAVRQLYVLARYGWRKFADHVIACNPVCQAIETHPLTFDPVQCTAPSTDVHHLVSPRTDVSRFKDPANVVALCKHHHGKTAGEPEGVRNPTKYVPTQYGFAATGGVRAVN